MEKLLEKLGWIRRKDWEGDPGEKRYYKFGEYRNVYEIKLFATHLSIKYTDKEFYEADGPPWEFIVTSINIKNEKELETLLTQLNLM